MIVDSLIFLAAISAAAGAAIRAIMTWGTK